MQTASMVSTGMDDTFAYRQTRAWEFKSPLLFRVWDRTPSLGQLALRAQAGHRQNYDLIFRSTEALRFDSMAFEAQRIENAYNEPLTTLCFYTDGRQVASVTSGLWCFYRNEVPLSQSPFDTPDMDYGEAVQFDDLTEGQLNW